VIAINAKERTMINSNKSRKANNGRNAFGRKVEYIQNTEFAKMYQTVTGTYKVTYKQYFNDDRLGMEFNNIADASEMFDMINMAGIEREELENLGFAQ
jgi:hypothetical protein